MKIQEVFEALSDPNRRAILELLKNGEMSVGEIGAHFNITGASLSHHLSKLKAADLVITKREGQTIYYRIHTSVFEDMYGTVLNLFSMKGRKK
jgi:ArsR family transcriptional regulator, arsenate/arsenite/antimonite-responsive transcriptional repressor